MRLIHWLLRPQSDSKWVRERGDRKSRLKYHLKVANIKKHVIAERIRLGEEYLAANAHDDPGIIVSKSSGIGLIDLRGTSLYEAAQKECDEMIRSAEGKELASKGSLEFVASGKKELGPDSACIALALSPEILCPAIRYFGCLPTLFSTGISSAKASELLEWSSHMYHLDPEDITQLKIFIHLTEVEADRAFYALPANLSAIVAEKLCYTSGRVPDDVVDMLVGSGKAIGSIGPKGRAVFCDTNRCFHYGGRPGRSIRNILMFQYSLPTSTWFPVSPADRERRNLLPMLKPSGELLWDALIGASLT